MRDGEPVCPLCAMPHARRVAGAPPRTYYRCPRCALIFVSPASLPSAAEERAVYDLHQNSPHDAGYRRFLSRLCDPLLERLPPAAQGLDFGCGPGPTLSVMLEEAGHRMALYDPFYAPFPEVWQREFDVITATEVVEHLHAPGDALAEVIARLRVGGWLGIMTKRALGKESFAQWHYTHDPTHVCFWSETTFNWLANQWQTIAEFPAADVVLLQKK